VNRRSWLQAGFALILGGCGYSTRPLYSDYIRTVYVPMFQSKTFRRGLEFQLTEAVVKEIERKTPFKVVGSEDADTVLEGTIRYADKRVVVESPEDEPRHIDLAIAVDVRWRDRRTGELLRDAETEPVSATLLVRQDVRYAPELGQSVATARQEVVDDLAEQIVAMMEDPW
jgi:hypothetical protein